MDRDLPFDRALRRLRRDRAAACGGRADYLHHMVADDMLDRLDAVRRDFSRALVLGCAAPALAGGLRARGLAIACADPGRRFAARAGGVQCEEDRLPFADGAFDLILSAGLLDTVNDLPGALALIRRALRPDGLFLGAMAGAGTLPALRSAMLAADLAGGAAGARLHPQIDLEAAGNLMMRAGFALPVVDRVAVDVRFPGLGALVADLRAWGTTNMLADRPPPLDRTGAAAAHAGFAARAEADGKTRETFVILHMSGWAPSPDQPRPARRGSAVASLADALTPRRSTPPAGE